MIPGLQHPGLMMLCKAQPNRPALLAEEMVPSTEEGQAKLETSAGLAAQAGVNVPGHFLGMSRTNAETGF